MLRGLSSQFSFFLSSFPAGKEWHQYQLRRYENVRNRNTRTRTLLPGAPLSRTRLTPCLSASTLGCSSCSLSLSQPWSRLLGFSGRQSLSLALTLYHSNTPKISRANCSLSLRGQGENDKRAALSLPSFVRALLSSHAHGVALGRRRRERAA